VPVNTGTDAVPRIQPNSVGIEIYTLRINLNQNELLQRLWLETDEQALPAALRRELTEHGFRVGIIGNFVPPPLTQLLQSAGSIETTQSDNGAYQEIPVSDLAKEATVTRQFRNVLQDMRVLVAPFDVPLPEYALFWNEHGTVTGQTLQNASGVFSIQAAAEKDSSATLMIVPEIEFGTVTPKYRTHVGVLQYENVRPRRKFESLMVKQKLLPGQWIIIGASSINSTGVGRAFFFRDNAVVEQRIIAVRLKCT
jgi:hypothetical protein